MANLNNRQLTLFVAWFLCMGFALAFSFSWIGLAALVVLGLIMLYTNVLGEKAKGYLIPIRLRHYEVSSPALLMLFFVLEHLDSFISGDTVDYYSFVTGLIFDHILLSISENLILTVVLAAVALVLVFIRDKFKKYPFLFTVLKYQFRTVLFALLFFFATGNVQIVGGYVAGAMVFIFCDFIRKVYSNLIDNVGIRWFGLFSLVLAALMFVNNGIYSAIASFTLQGLMDVFGKWYVALFLLVVTVGAFIVTHCFQDNYKAETTFEETTYVALASFIPVLFFAGSFYAGMGWVFVALYLAFVIFYMGHKGPLPGKYESFKQDFSKYKTVPVAAVMTSFVIIEAHYGKFFMAAVFALSLVFGWMLGKKCLEIKNESKKNSWLYTLILGLLYLNTLMRMLTFHSSVYLMVVMAVVCAVLIAVIWVVNYNPDVYLHNKYLAMFQYAVPALFLVLCLIAFVHGGTSVSLEADNDTVIVEAEAQGKENDITELSYIWVVDAETLGESMSNADDEESKYIKIESGAEIELQTGMLKIVAVDANGVKTTTKRWYDISEEGVTPFELPQLAEEE